ncbi:uncharacterized protein I303_104351 [Kwoniella dejecticola CBS 10117]|uniref:ubiquitinyl hydrolase 1 n=1 Tax=Kwoniella dejecticola CBS 10117 TaxID=1296121 RepID=A0A1A6A5K2_9TREE|nr:uncharacterized protein I303_04674 [Kwoniella dejecticola CBS 10117]OBR85339.1 hypothetical protein I303_04674 [Kwoniella dejecticola CBS 10117]
MTTDKPSHAASSSSSSSKSPKSPRSPIRSHAQSHQADQPFKSHTLLNPTSPSSSAHKPHSRPAGPRSPEHLKSPRSETRDHPGSSRTRYRTVPIPVDPSSDLQSTHDIPQNQPHSKPQPLSFSPSKISREEELPHAPYRPPEAVIEPPEEHPPGYTPGIVAEHIGSDDDMAPPPHSPSVLLQSSESTLDDEKRSADVNNWQADVKSYDMDVDSPDLLDLPRPQSGPGILPRRLLMLLHEHGLVQPQITELPPPYNKKPQSQPQTQTQASPSSQTAWNGSNRTLTAPSSRPASVASSSGMPGPPSPSPSTASAPSLPDVEHLSTLDDVWEALPGGKDNRHQWYFCTTCWGWLKITTGVCADLEKRYMEGWQSVSCVDKEGHRQTYAEYAAEWQKYNEATQGADMSEINQYHHFHEFTKSTDTLLLETRTNESIGEEEEEENRIERVMMKDEMNVFPHITFGMEDEDPNLLSFKKTPTPSKLFISSSSDLWVQVHRGPAAGQIPTGLVHRFTSEKMSNPTMGTNGTQGVSDAWNLLATLLANPLFKGQRGWVKLDNPKFQREIGASMTSSHLLYQIGFGCQQEEDGFLRVGPLKAAEEPTDEATREQKQMDRYMIRTWVEICLYLAAYQARNGITFLVTPSVTPISLEKRLEKALDLDKYPKSVSQYGDLVRNDLYTLGVTKTDKAETVEIAYGLQISSDKARSPLYLTALEKVAEAPVYGREMLQMRVATERSLDKYSSDEVDKAYNLIGYTPEYTETLCVLPSEAPDDHILDLHKKAVQSSSTSQEKQDLSKALIILGRERGSELMKTLGENGQTLMSVQEAYSALSCPEDAVDDGLLMQYEMAVNEYPGKAEHYKNCLSIIADAPGRERPGVKTFLQTGSREPEAPARKDIPVGLHNIGYLNSILQYLYSIKPLREAVISFEQDPSRSINPQKPDVERSKRFVRQLRLLFLQLYKSETSSVRPDEELAYLAITRPEVDAIVEPHVEPPAPAQDASTSKFTLDDIPDIPDIPSPSSTQVATPVSSPEIKPINSSASTSTAHKSSMSTIIGDRDWDRESSILGKRASEDRDDSSRSSEEIVRHINRVGSPTEMEVDDFELVPRPQADADIEAQSDRADSPSATMDLGHLDLKSPVPESKNEFVSSDDLHRHETTQEQSREEEAKYEPPSVPPPLPPRPQLAKKDTLNSGLRFGLQQDSAEVLINVLSQLELALDRPPEKEGEKGTNLIQSLFSCKYKQQIIYETSAPSKTPSSGRRESITYEAQKPVESVFVHPIIGVEEENKDLYDCLAELYLKGADIEYENKKGHMMDLMDSFPDLLYIQMRRSQYDPATGRERKTNTHIPFSQTLSMGRFLATADPQKRDQAIDLTREMTSIRSRLHQLRNHKPLSIPETFKHVSSSLRQLSQLDIDIPEIQQNLSLDFLNALDTESAEVEKEIVHLQEQLPVLKKQMDDIWFTPQGEDEWEYELVSVFMHRGKNSGSGHYWTFQSWLPDHGDTFFKYNDETVTQVPSSEVLQDRTGDDANPALLCYVRKGKRLIDTLHREVLELEQGEMGLDMEMKMEAKKEESNLIDL